MLRVLIACEVSGIVRDAFRKRGHDAWSVDLLPSDTPGPHIICDLTTWKGEQLLKDNWDLMIAHPPCTYLTCSSNSWRKSVVRRVQQALAIQFFLRFYNASIPSIAVENPIGVLSTIVRKPDQVIQPYFFGHHTTKATCLWLKNLPVLTATHLVKPYYVKTKSGRFEPLFMYETSSLPQRQRSKARSQTFHGIAEAMAQQWGDFLDT